MLIAPVDNSDDITAATDNRVYKSCRTRPADRLWFFTHGRRPKKAATPSRAAFMWNGA